MQKSEIVSLTGLRGIAAVFVMLYHYRGDIVGEGLFGNFVTHGYLMVDLFFVLSGFIIAMTYWRLFESGCTWQDYRSFIVRRLARIYPLYFVLTICAGLLIYSGWMDRWPGPPLWSTALINFAMIQNWLLVPSLDTPGWSISAEWTAYLIFPVLVFLCLRGSRPLAVAVALACIVALPTLTMLPALADQPKRTGLLDIWHYGTVFPVVRCVIEFSLGMLAYRLTRNGTVRAIASRSWLSAVVIAAIFALMTVRDADVLIVLLFPALVLALSTDCHTIARAVGCGFLRWLGVLSYAIYLIHNLMNYFIIEVSEYLAGHGIAQSYLIAMALFSTISIGLAQLAYSGLEKPARTAVKQWLEPRRPAPVAVSPLTAGEEPIASAGKAG